MAESAIVATKLTEDEFLRRFRAGLIAAWLIPPATGELGMTFLGFWELRDAGLSLIRFSGVYVIVFTFIGFYVFKYLVIKPVVALGDRQRPPDLTLTNRLKAFPWVFWGLLGLYTGLGPPTVLLSNAVFQGAEYTLEQYVFSAFGAIPFLLIAAFPLFFYLTDLVGRFLAPRGIMVMVAPLWLKVTVLGLFTPVMIDTILVTYYFNRTGFLTIETIVLWFVLVLIAGAGMLVALHSFSQGMLALTQPLGRVVEAGISAYPVPRSLDEFGLLARGWADLLKSRDHAERRVREGDRQVRDIIDHTDAVIYIKDKAGHFLLINRRFEQLLGVSNDDVVGKTDHDIFPKEYADIFQKNDLEVIRNKKHLKIEESVPHEGGPHTYISQKFPLYDADRVLYGLCGISSDITERLQASEKLRLSEARLSGIIQVANDAIITVDQSQRIILFNQGAEQVFGYSRDEILGRPLDVLLPERFRSQHRKNIRRFENEETSARQMERSMQLSGCRKNGDEFPLEASISKLDLGGETIFTVALRDITTRKLAEETLVKREASLSEAQRIAHLGNWDLDIVKNELTWSDEIFRIFDMEPREFGASYEAFLETVHPDDREFVDKAYVASVKNKTPYDIAHRLLTKDGAVKFVHEKGETFYDEDGNPQRSVGTVQDITERKRAEMLKTQYQHGLMKLDSQVRNLLQVAGDSGRFYELVCVGIMELVDADIGALPLIDETDDTLTYVAAMGSNAELLQGHTLPLRQGGLCGWVVTHGEPLRVSDLASDPRSIPELVQALNVTTGLLTPLTREGRVIGGLSAFRKGRPFDDIEEQILTLYGQQVSSALDNLGLLVTLEQRVAKRTAELAAANERLKELDRLKTMFIASMSHELRTPLNSIIGFTGVILQGMTGKITAKQTDQLTRVNTAAKHLLALISDVIDISKIEADKVEAFLETFELNDLLEEAVETVRAEIEKKGLDLEVSVPRGLRLHTDRKRLLQCLLNYLTNAVKFTPDGTIKLAVRNHGDELEITVSDTGIGIQEEDLARLFRPFVRFESPLRHTAPGTGLGLYLTKKLVTGVLGGSVSVESHPGEGSTFRLRVPMSEVASSRQLTREQEGGV